MRTLEALVWWLGTTDFSASHLGGEYAALSALSCLHTQVDSSHAGLMRLIHFTMNLDTPRPFFENEQSHSGFPVRHHISFHEATEAIGMAVGRRPHLRKAVAQYLLFEDLGCYDAVTLAEIAQQVEQEYRWEYGDAAFASSTRDVANTLARAETERESLHTMLTLALEIGTHHIRSRLAVNWLARVRLHDETIQQAIDRLKQMTMKQIWQLLVQYSSNDPAFLTALLRGDS